MTHLLACGSELGSVLVLTLTSARPALWSVCSVYPTMAVITCAVDEVKAARLVPGVERLEQRWMIAHPDKPPAGEDCRTEV